MSRTRLRESIPDNPYHLMVLDLIRDAVEMVRGEVKAATATERAKALAFLRDTKCQRWCDYVGLEYEALLRAAGVRGSRGVPKYNFSVTRDT